MNLFRSLHNVGQFLQSTKEALRSLVEFKEESIDVGPDEKKKEVNDVTMVSEGKIQDDSFVSNPTSLLSEPLPKLPIRYEQTGIFGGQSSSNL